MENFTESELRTLVEAGAVKDVLVKRRHTPAGQIDAWGAGWVVWVETGKGSKLVRTKRDPIRVWKDLGRCAAWLRDLGIGRFRVEQD